MYFKRPAGAVGPRAVHLSMTHSGDGVESADTAAALPPSYEFEAVAREGKVQGPLPRYGFVPWRPRGIRFWRGTGAGDSLGVLWEVEE